MATFADMKNDFVFRRIFATRPDLLRALLNDLLERSEERAIVDVQYLPSEQLPLVEGAKLSILDVRCRDKTGTTFVVEMQLIHHEGFINRVVYNACKAFVGQLKSGEWYSKLTDVVAISICDFELWPDAAQDRLGAPRIPTLSRWNMTERNSRNHGLLQVQYAFLELPKLPPPRPEGGAPLWAWLFVHASDLTAIPPELPAGPYREALELANESSFTQAELDAYQKVRDEIRQVTEIRSEAETRGRAEGKAASVLMFLGARGIPVSPEERARIEGSTDIATLDRWILRAATAKAVEELF